MFKLDQFCYFFIYLRPLQREHAQLSRGRGAVSPVYHLMESLLTRVNNGAPVHCHVSADIVIYLSGHSPLEVVLILLSKGTIVLLKMHPTTDDVVVYSLPKNDMQLELQKATISLWLYSSTSEGCAGLGTNAWPLVPSY